MPAVRLAFFRGGSFPEHLAEPAAGLEMPAMALLDRNGIYGAQRFSVAARRAKYSAHRGFRIKHGGWRHFASARAESNRLQKFVRAVDTGAPAQRSNRRMRGEVE